MATDGQPSFAAPPLSTSAVEISKGAAAFQKIALLLGDQWSDVNSNGVINFGVAENSLLHAELKEFWHSKFTFTDVDFTYGDEMLGSKRLFKALSKLFNTRFNPLLPVEPDHLVTGNGASAVIDQAVSLLCNPGDAVLIARPYYNGFDTDLGVRAKVRPVGVDVGPDPTGPSTLGALERELLRLKSEGIATRAVILTNPHNPLGFNYPRETVAAYCRFCEKHDLHLLSDEIYALSQYQNEKAQGAPQFTSVLSLDVVKEAGCNPARVHVIYGMSKDFCANGLRVGVFVTQHNPELRRAFTGLALFSKVSSASDSLWSALLNDEQMLERFVSDNQQRLAETFEYCAAFFRKYGIPFVESRAAHFIWLDLRKLLREQNDESKALDAHQQEEDLWEAFIEERLFISPGFIYHATEPGRFRFTFCVRRDALDVGLARFARLLEKRGVAKVPESDVVGERRITWEYREKQGL